MTTTRAGEVWLAEVEFVDATGSKPRPVLVLFSHGQDSVLAVITSTARRTDLDISIRNWKAAGLRRPSIARLDKLITMSHNRLWARLGHLGDADWRRVVNLWNDRMKLDP